MNNYPLRHLSIRVPWHDNRWKGTVCNSPTLNGACTKLGRIAAGKDVEGESTVAGRSFEDIPQEQWPCCVDERVAFMAPFEMEQIKEHALAKKNPKQYGHFVPTKQRYPAFSAGIVPFSWMMRANLDRLKDELSLDIDLDREPDLGYETDWIHEETNQRSLLDGFAAHIRKDDSLCFFYAKHVPFYEGTARIIVGVGRVKEICSLREYDRSREGMRGMLWERPVQHSIRPDQQDGFLMPYHDIIHRHIEDKSLNIEDYVVHAPDESWDQFSYGSELLTHDSAISSLISIDNSLKKIEQELGIATAAQCQWIHDELVRLWKVRGPYPGLGAVLRATGISRGVFVANILQDRAGENSDPWPFVDKAFQNPTSMLPQDLVPDVKQLSKTWTSLPSERKTFLKLLSRFELTIEQAEILYDESARTKHGWHGNDASFILNPYLLFENSRRSQEIIHLTTVDRGLFR